MLFNYEAITNIGEKKKGVIDASSRDLAVVAIQKRGLIVLNIVEAGKEKGIFSMNIPIFSKTKIPIKDIVVMSRQISTLFEGRVSPLRAFSLIASNSTNKNLVSVLEQLTEDVKSGLTISDSMAKHKQAFSDFYVNMIRAGEESGKLVEAFSYLADYLDRQYQLTSKTKNALIYPSFVIGVFIIVMTMMFIFVVPKLADIIREAGQEIPFFTKIVMSVSDIFLNYGIFILLILAIGVVYLIKLNSTESGKKYIDRTKLSVPIIRDIYKKLYLARIADNIDTMLSSGIQIVRALEITGAVVDNVVYEDIMKLAAEDVKAGSTLSEAFAKHSEIPSIMVGMIKVGEESASVGNILKTLGKFYAREVNEAVDNLVNLIEPIMIILLGLGVGTLLASILIPIYNIAGGIE